ncbi:MAG TPA: glycoside hydrolase family 31 protein [Opitutus sp.]|nr:glycoside hydrolase family 31 protein [Opitutus sp.]
MPPSTPKDSPAPTPAAGPAPVPPRELPLEAGESWWGGRVVDAAHMPYGAGTPFRSSLHAGAHSGGNQAQPFLVSSTGRYVWNDAPFDFAFESAVLRLSAAVKPWTVDRAGTTLREGFHAAARRFFPPSGRMPDAAMFTAPQYNTWIELGYDQTEERILDYARTIVAAGYPPGVLMIDDNWQDDYGAWDFAPRRFSRPKAMIDELHTLGFRVMLWVCPFVSPDSATGRELARRRLLLRQQSASLEVVGKDTPNDAALIRWWNGASAVLDLSHPETVAWFANCLARLVREFGVDGFKFDAGDSHFYVAPPGSGGFRSFAPRTPEEHTMDFARIGRDFPLNEYRAGWKCAGQPLAQRLRDKDHSWTALRELIPGVIAQGLMGHAFTCPDMIGGGLAGAFENGPPLDAELVVRSAQVHALMPMMQFSLAPWRALAPEPARLCLAAARLHAAHGDAILRLARNAAATGEPIVRPLEWQWPHQGHAAIADQFMLGDDLLVAPVVTKGATHRRVAFPPGKWRGDDGSVVTGPVHADVAAPLERLPFFRRD